MKRQLGLTLLEVTMALSIGGIMLLLAIRGVAFLDRHNNINVIKSEIALLRFAAEEYHLQVGECDSFDKTPSITDLITGAFLPAGFNPDNTFGGGYTVDFGADSQADNEPPVYDISLTLTAPKINAEYYAQSLGAQLTGNQLKWKYPMLAKKSYQTGSLLRFREFYRASDGSRCL